MQDQGLKRDSLLDFARVISKLSTRKIFVLFCREVLKFSYVNMEMDSFDLRFIGDNGFELKVSPYRELFVISLGERDYITLRVSSFTDYLKALDIALQSYLEKNEEVVKGEEH